MAPGIRVIGAFRLHRSATLRDQPPWSAADVVEPAGIGYAVTDSCAMSRAGNAIDVDRSHPPSERRQVPRRHRQDAPWNEPGAVRHRAGGLEEDRHALGFEARESEHPAGSQPRRAGLPARSRPRRAARRRATGETLESLGIVTPAPAPVVVPPPPPPAPPPPLPTALVVEAVVCAAADALQAPPSAVRGALLAAFCRARELRLSVNDVESALAGSGGGGAKPAS
jgi:hypothetical protein